MTKLAPRTTVKIDASAIARTDDTGWFLHSSATALKTDTNRIPILPNCSFGYSPIIARLKSALSDDAKTGSMNDLSLNPCQPKPISHYDADRSALSYDRAHGRLTPDITITARSKSGILQTDSPSDLFGRPINRGAAAIVAGGMLRDSRHQWIEWPVIADGVDLPNTKTFDWQNQADAFKKPTVICVYIAISDGLCSLAKSSRLSLAKIGISRRPDVSVRMAEINTDKYAGIACLDGHWQSSDGYDNWEPVRLPASTHAEHPSPVERLPRSLLVSLPASLSVETFDAELKSHLEQCILSNWIDTADGEIHCARHGVDRAALKRFTSHTNADGSIRLKASTELYVFRTKQDMDRLIQVIEGIIAGHLQTCSSMP